jgi:hypothetical protein
MIGELQIIDCHQQFYDSHLMRCGVFIEPGAGFAAVVGDYAPCPASIDRKTTSGMLRA